MHSIDKVPEDRLSSAIASARAAKERCKNALHPVTRLLRAAKILRYPSLVRRLHVLRFLRQFVDRELCFFLSRPHYLSRYFRVWDRIHNALLHYEHESRSFDSGYRAQVYSPNGLLLWKETKDGIDVSIRLVVTESNESRQGIVYGWAFLEGDLSVILEVNGHEAGRMSYTVVDGATFGLASLPTLFVTRNQLKRTPELELFRRCYRHSSPQYFCLAAVAGIAMANGFRYIAAIRGKAQSAYRPQFDEQFQNSYCKFWQQFGAKAIDRQAWLMPVPLDPPPISAVTAKHRGRANDRRALWAAITCQAMSAISAHRLEEPASTGLMAWLPPMLWINSADMFCDFAQMI